jgi:clostripain
MKRAIAVLCIMLMVCSGLGYVNADNTKKTETPTVANWTIMVYMSADNNLEEAGVHDLNEMEVAGSTDKVNIVAQMDRADGYDTTNGDWTTTKRFLVQKDDLNGEIASKEIMDLNETDMGDPNTLSNFTIWAIDNYPAEKYALILWDHGGAFWGVDWDDDPNGTAQPGYTSDWLSMPDLTAALFNITAHLGRKIDLMGFDACLMADFDVIFQLRSYTDYTVASGYVEPGEGWPYDWILPKLVDKPDMDARELGKIICDDYVDSYTDKASDPQDTTAQTMALFESSKLAELGHQLDLMAMLLAMNTDTRPLKGNWAQIYWARDKTNSYDFPTQYTPLNLFPLDPGGYAMYDVIDLMDNLIKYFPADSQIKAQAQAVKTAAQDAEIYFRCTGYQETVKGAHGITIYFPSGSDTKYSARYDPTDVAKETYWDEFLHYWIDKKSAANTPPSVLIKAPKDGDALQLGQGGFAVTGTASDYQNDVGTVEYSVDGGEWKAATGSTDWAFPLNTKDLGAGDHIISVRASDASSSSGEVKILIKIEAPEKPHPGTTNLGNNMNIMAAAVLFVALVVVGALLLGRSRRKK